MHEFKYKGDQLYCEDVGVADIAKRVPTPFFLYSHRTLIDHFRKVKEAFKPVRGLVCFSMKSNSNLAVCKVLIREGAGLDVVSGGELYKALKVGAQPKRIVYASVGKTRKEIAKAIEVGILFFNVESVPELELIDQMARKVGKKVRVSLRLNPNIDPKTHRFISTAKSADKFGLDFVTVKELFLNRKNYQNVNLIGVHLHIGSQITQSQPFVKAIKLALRLIQQLREMGVKIDWLNIGGGLGIVYGKEKPQTAREFARAVSPLLKGKDLKVILEPGRFIAGNSGILVTRVLYVKQTPAKRFVIVDTGMNDFIRPALYGAYHEILPVESRWYLVPGSWSKADVVGPVCESADFLARNRKMPPLESGDLLAVMGAGAYCFTMSSNYNSRPRAAEVMVRGKKFSVVKKRETYRDLVRGEVIPPF